MNKLKEYKYIIIIALVVFIVIGFLFWKNIKIRNTIINETNPLKIIDCEFAPKFNYWNHWEKNYNYEKDSWEDQRNKRQGNFYISCESEGTAKMMNVYIFKDYKLFFKQENISRGKFFADNENNFYIIQETTNGYILTKYEFDLSKNILIEKEVREYKTKQEIENFYIFEKENNARIDDSSENILNECK